MTRHEVQPSDGLDELVALAKAGDDAAFAELVRMTGDEIYTLALRLVNDRELAADVAQESLVRAWKALPGFRGDAAFTTWLHRITVNTAWTHKKRLKRHRSASLDELVHDPVAEGLTPERAGVAAGRAGELEAALLSLPAEQRAVVVLRDVYGWSHAEVAEHLGISVTAAKVRLHRGHQRLRIELRSR